MKKVVVKPAALEFLNELIEVLVKKEYFGFLDSAEEYVNWLYDFILHDLPEQKPRKTPKGLKRYGRYYTKLKSNKRTTWYIFFDELNKHYIVKHITNNHVIDASFLQHL